MTPRPCISCGRLVPSGSRCADCAAKAQRDKRRRRPHSATAAEKRRRADAVVEWIAIHGLWCPGWGEREAHGVVWPNVLTADHAIPVAAGGAEDGPLTVRCRRCNSARGAKP